MGNWSKVPALQIAASLEKMAWQERKLSIDNGGADTQHSICVLKDLRGLLGYYDLPVFVFFPLFFSIRIFLVFSVRVSLSDSLSA